MRTTNALLTAIALACSPAAAHADEAIKKSLTFHASFDDSSNAGTAKGDGKIYTLVDKKPKPGLHTDGATRLAKGKGRTGDALEFTKKSAPWVFFKSAKNLPYAKKNWSGSVSLWLKLDPEKDLEPGYCDPMLITTRAWNDGAFFVDFDKAGDPRDFRLGAFADLKVWNPEKKDIPEDKRPLKKVKNPPFGSDQWTHVLFTWEKFNTGEKDAMATFYLNGEKQGTITGWQQTFSWGEDEESRINLGINYIGLLDEVSCFDRVLTDEEVAKIFKAPEGVASLISASKP